MFLLLAVARGDRGLLLLRPVREDCRTVLIADVWSLAIELRGIVNLPEQIEQLVVRHALGIVNNFDRFRVSSPVTADLTVRRVLRVAAGVARDGLFDSGKLTKCGFDPPAAAGRKGRNFRFHTLLRTSRRGRWM